MCAVVSEAGRWKTSETGVNSTSWTASATKTTQLALRRTSARRRGSAPSSHASRTPNRVRTPRITSRRRRPRPCERAQRLVERDELGHRLDLLAERADDLRRDLRCAVGHGNLAEQRGDAVANDVETLLVGYEHRDPELVVANPADGVLGAGELAEPALGVVDEALRHELSGDDPDLVERVEVDEEDRTASGQPATLLGAHGLDFPLEIGRTQTIHEDAEKVLLDGRRSVLQTEREPQLAPVEVAELEPAAAREVELRERLVPRSQATRLREHVVRDARERVDRDRVVADPARVAAEPGEPAADPRRRERALGPIPVGEPLQHLPLTRARADQSDEPAASRDDRGERERSREPTWDEVEADEDHGGDRRRHRDPAGIPQAPQSREAGARPHPPERLPQGGDLLGPERVLEPLLPHHRGEGAGDERVELRLRLVQELLRRLLHAQGRAVRSCRGHGVEAVGRDEHVSFDRDLRARHAVVALAVVPLVVQLDEERHLAREMEGPEQEGGQARMPTDRVQLVRGQAAGPGQGGHVDGDLAEVVELRSGDDALSLPLGELDEVEEPLDVGRDSLGVLARRRVASVDDVSERLERLRRLLPQMIERGPGAVEGQAQGRSE